MPPAPDGEAAAESELPENPLTEIVRGARSGLRRDVQRLLEALDDFELLVPLSRDVPDTPLGERVELEGELTLSPHLLPDSEGQLFCPLFTHTDPLEPIVSALDWTTDGEPLKVCSFPARIALQMAHDVVDEQNVFGVVVDAGTESELCLTRAEAGSLLSGRAVPLLAYVANIPGDEQERTLLAEPADPPPAEFSAALSAFCADKPSIIEHRLNRTFNPDRDLEPHWTLTLRVSADANREELFETVTAAVEAHVPPPGYLDVLFES